MCYDAFPGVSYTQVNRLADWYEKTRAFQREASKPDGSLEDKVSAFFEALSQSPKVLPNDAVVDTELDSGWQYEDVPEHVARKS